MLTTEELLKPRYKVIADYPNQYQLKGRTINNLFYDDEYKSESFFDAYPDIFRKLEWWQERKPEDMPGYVRFGESEMRHTVYKIKEWHLNGIYRVDTVCAIAEEPKDYLLIFGAGKCYPNTESEYLTYKNKTDG